MAKHLTTSVAYLSTLHEVLERGEPSAPRGQSIRELLNYGFEVVRPGPDAPHTLDPERDRKVARYLNEEFRLYYSGERRASEYAKAAPMWASLANPDGTINSAYGWLIFFNPSTPSGVTPWAYARARLLVDQDTRQAVIRVSLPEHDRECTDVVCTMHMAFHIRRDRLHLSVVMRSNDVVKGLVYDMPFFCSLQQRMLDDLEGRYPWLRLGSYYHFAHSMHMYERDLDTVNKMLGVAA